MLEQLDQQQAVYNVPSAARFCGPLDLTSVTRSINEIVRRHEVLRTRFVLRANELRQVVTPYTPFQLEVVDISHLSSANRDAAARDIVTEDARRPFDIAKDAPLRAFVVRLAEEDHIFVLNIHHIVTDGYSMGVLTDEFLALYRAYSTNQPSPLRELPVQFGDYADWHRRWLTGAELERQTTFWRATLQPPLPTLQLPTDRPRPGSLSGRGLHEHVQIPRDITSRLRAFGRQYGFTVFEILLGGFAVLLHSYSKQSDIIIGSPVANRNRTEVENLIGYFVNVLPYRIKWHGDPSFEQLVARVHEASQDVHAHQELAFSKIVEIVRPPRDASRNPIYQVELTMLEPNNTPSVYGYGFQTIAEHSLQLGEVTMSPFPVESGVSKFDLTMLLWNLPAEIQGTIEYSTDLFDQSTICAMMKRFVSLLDRALNNRDVRLSELCVVQQPAADIRRPIGAVKRRPIPVAK